MNKIQEAYITLQAEYVKLYDLRVGDSVRILREHGSCELGSTGVDHQKSILNSSGWAGTVHTIVPTSIHVRTEKGVYSWGCPLCLAFHLIEITDQPRESKIEVRKENRYYKDGVDVTDKISADTKANLGTK